MRVDVGKDDVEGLRVAEFRENDHSRIVPCTDPSCKQDESGPRNAAVSTSATSR